MRVLIRTLDGRLVERGVVDGVWAEEGEGPTVDLASTWAIGGLADAHAHLAQAEMVLEPGDPEGMVRRAYAALDAGVFLCFDKGWTDETVLGLFDRPPSERPHLEAAGRMIAGHGGYFDGFAVETDDAGLANVVRANLGRGGWVKLVGDWPRRGRGAVPNFTQEALGQAVAVAHEAGARVAIHTMAPEVASMAVAAGIDSIEHGLYLTDADLELLGARGGAWVPTVLRMEAVVRELGPERTGGRVVSAGLSRVRDLLPGAADLGVSVLSGSDLAVSSASVAQEAIRLVSYGLTEEQAVASVSATARAYAGLEEAFKVGSPADVVAFPRHPYEDISVLAEPMFVLRAGELRRDLR